MATTNALDHLHEKVRADVQQDEVQDLLHPGLAPPAHPTEADKLGAELLKATHQLSESDKVRARVATTLEKNRERLANLEKLLATHLPAGALKKSRALLLGVKADLIVAEDALERGWSRPQRQRKAGS